MLAVHLENLLFLLLLVVAGLFQLLGKAARKTNTDETERTSTPPPRARKPIPRASTESDQERIRKFLEALGQPPASRPPPPALPRTDVPPRPLAPVQPPLARAWELARAERRKRHVILVEGPAPETPKPAEETFPPAITRVPAFEVHEEPPQVEPPPPIKTPVETYAAATRPVSRGEGFKADTATLLASKTNLREAIILREILGPPRGLRASELL
jgi:hypothetical protein